VREWQRGLRPPRSGIKKKERWGRKRNCSRLRSRVRRDQEKSGKTCFQGVSGAESQSDKKCIFQVHQGEPRGKAAAANVKKDSKRNGSEQRRGNRSLFSTLAARNGSSGENGKGCDHQSGKKRSGRGVCSKGPHLTNNFVRRE